jgi:DNA (cytosine-5)-methyltransferase 1
MEKTDKLGISPTLTARGAGEEHSGMILVKEVATLDEYNGTINHNGIIGTIIATQFKQGHGHSIIEPKLDVVGNVQTNGRENGNIYNSDGLSPTLLARDYKDPKKIVEPSLVIPEDTNLGYALAHEGDGVYTNRPEQKRGVVQKQMIQTIKANSNDLGVVVKEDIVIGSTQKNAFVGSINGHAPSLTSAMGAGGGHTPMITNNLRIRKLTPRECYRLMGFGDQAFDLAQPNQSNSSLYHQAGDSIVVNVLMELFRSLI